MLMVLAGGRRNTVTSKPNRNPNPTRMAQLPDVTPAHLAAFRQDLVDWYRASARVLPWRETRDPYSIWLSEMMLQQTRVDQALPYYQRFLAAFPTVFDLAAAPVDQVLKLWEGLGYYARARNLHKAAQAVVEDFGGTFPKSEAEIRKLAGIGAYTAAAVLSIAYNVPLAVLDGNVIRVLARVFALEADVKQPKIRQLLQVRANELLSYEAPGDFNQGIMELGAITCTPRNPQCSRCPLQQVCTASQTHQTHIFPMSAKKAPIPHQHIAIGVILNDDGLILIDRRPESGLLGGLWEFPGGKQEAGETLPETCAREIREEVGIEVEVGDQFAQVDHAYTHFKITLHAFLCRLTSGTAASTNGEPVKWVSLAELEAYAFPKANRHVIDRLHERLQMPTLFASPFPVR